MDFNEVSADQLRKDYQSAHLFKEPVQKVVDPMALRKRSLAIESDDKMKLDWKPNLTI